MIKKRKLIKKRNQSKVGRHIFLLGLLLNLLIFSNLQAQCIIDGLVIEHSPCNNLNQFTVDIDFDWAGGVDSFSVAGNGNNYGHFSKFDLPITISSPYFIGDGTTIYEFVVSDLEFQNDCSTWGVIGPITCDSNNDCGITNITYTLSPCNPNDQFTITFDFDWEFTSDFFTVMGNGVDYGTFSYAFVPLTLGPFPGDGTTVWEFGIFDQDFPDCGGWVEPGIVNCPPIGDCVITNLEVEAVDCGPNGTQSILIDFDVENAPNDYFDILDAGGNYLAYFLIDDLPVTWDGFIPSGNDYDYLQICINDTPNCCSEIEFMPLNCGSNCAIGGLEAVPSDCNPNGIFTVSLNFEYENTSDSFTVVGNGQNYGTFAYSDLPIQLGPFAGDGSVLEFIVQDQDQPDCGSEVVIDSPNCNGGDCDIFDLVVDPGDCNNDGTYALWINFEYQNPGNDFFEVFASNGQFLGYFPLNELPIMVNYPASGNDYDFLQVCINDNPNCCQGIEFLAPDCSGNNCEIWDLVVEAYDCDDQGMFLVDIDFNFANTSDSFTVVGNGQNYGTFAYTDLYITLGPFEGNGSTYEFIIQDQDQTDCGGELILESENCSGGDCDIFDLVVETGDCNNDGTYALWINFEYQNPGNDFFEVFASNGQFLGYFPLNELPIMVNYPASGNDYDFLQVCINDNPNCCQGIEFLAPDCSGNNCEIWDLVVEAYDCDDQGMFLVDIDFNFANTSDSFTVVGNGQNYGTFAYTDLYITLGPFEGNGSTYEFIIQDQDQTDCGGELILESENCSGGDCDIFDLVVETGDCNNDGTYELWINFEYQNPGNDFFEVFASNGQFLGFFPLNELPIMVNYPASGNDYDFLQVCINDNPNCCQGIEFLAPDCSGNNCEIWDLVVEAYDCDDQGMFLVDIDFNYANTSDSFTVVGNGQNYGTFAYTDLYITLGPFEGNGSTYEFIIQDQDQPDCGGELILESENCSGGDCDISNLNVYPLDCNPDGTYSVLVLFDYENVNGVYFDVYANGNYLDSYAYDDLPLSIPSFPGSGNTNDVITICDSDSDLCCETVEFDALDCEACEIYDVVAIPGPCDNDDNFMVSLDFEHNGTGILGFLVFGNGNNYGVFDYVDLPISLGPFAGDGITAYEFIVVDLVNVDCIGYTELDPVLCNVPPPVWPGDINADFISNNFDLLNLGIAYGEIGPARAQSNIEWMSWEGPDWTQTYANGTNMKHADCNGDGIVDNIDLTAIDLNYNQVHGDVIPYDTISVSPDDPPFYVDLPTLDQLEIGEAFTAPIILGSLETPIESIYGIAFTIEYDPSMMDEAGVYVETTNSWLGNQGTQLINVNKNFSDEGIIEVAITRIDHNNTDGFGTISYFIGIIDDIAGKNEVKINITNVVAITYEELRIPIAAASSTIDLTTSTTEISEMEVSVYPNPANETVNILTEANDQLQSITVYNALGQKVTQLFSPKNWERLDVSSWSDGLYFIDLQFAKGRISKKVKVIK